MYNSPIKIYETAMQTIMEERENAIFAKVQSAFGVDVDKDELLRALQYDRGQYAKGYADGKADAAQQWIPVSERLPKPYVDVITLRQDLLSRANTVGLEYITIQGIADIPAWSKDHMTWKNKVTHWMPLPEPPKEG